MIRDLNEIRQMKFDFIMCCHVLEHVSYPNQVLTSLKSFSHSDTMFYFETPANDVRVPTDAVSRMKMRLRPIKMHEHINSFGISSMKNMLESQGFDIRFIGTKRFDLGWINNVEILSCLAKLRKEN